MGQKICRNPLAPVKGYIPLPTAPGLGLEIDEAALGRYPYQQFPVRRLAFPEDEGP
jgi:galactonate dehydratase